MNHEIILTTNRTNLTNKSTRTSCLLARTSLIEVNGLVLFGLFLFQLAIEVRAEFGVFCLDIDCHSEDAAGINKTFGEDAEDGFMDLSGGRYDETCDGE